MRFIRVRCVQHLCGHHRNQDGRKKADKEHPYGHERMECVAAILLSAVLALTGAGIGFSGLRKIAGGSFENLAVPGILAMGAAVLSIVVKEWMFWYTRANAKKSIPGR